MITATISRVVYPIACTVAFYGVLIVLRLVHRELTSPLRGMVGPASPSLILGNFQAMARDSSLTAQWRSQFGRNFRFRSLFGRVELHTSDIKAVNHIVTNGSIYQKLPSILDISKDLLGNGILSVELEDHKRQEKTNYGQEIFYQAFAPAQIRLLTELFTEKAVQLRDSWASQVSGKPEGVVLDVSFWLRRVTLDVIGQAGERIQRFNYDFESLAAHGDEKPDELNQAFTNLMHSPNAQLYAGFRVAQSLMPVLKLFPIPGREASRKARTVMDAIASQIISKSKEELKTVDKSGDMLKGKRDLLSVLLKSNVSHDIPESHRMSDSDMAAQIPTFLFAGHETTSTSISWGLHALSLKPAVQSKLRDELLAQGVENPTMDELNALPYLDCVVREVLRLHAPVHSTQRIATQDDVIPLATPYIDSRGEAHETLRIPEGQIMHLPILALNTDPDIWGADALAFIPERWEHVPEASNAIPGVYSHLFTFFGGAHGCIGYRFSIVEMKAILFMIIRAFEFAPAVPDIVPQSVGLIHRPAVLGKDGNRVPGLPLLVKAYNSDGF